MQARPPVPSPSPSRRGEPGLPQAGTSGGSRPRLSTFPDACEPAQDGVDRYALVESRAGPVGSSRPPDGLRRGAPILVEARRPRGPWSGRCGVPHSVLPGVQADHGVGVHSDFQWATQGILDDREGHPRYQGRCGIGHANPASGSATRPVGQQGLQPDRTIKPDQGVVELVVRGFGSPKSSDRSIWLYGLESISQLRKCGPTITPSFTTASARTR